MTKYKKEIITFFFFFTKGLGLSSSSQVTKRTAFEKSILFEGANTEFTVCTTQNGSVRRPALQATQQIDFLKRNVACI